MCPPGEIFFNFQAKMQGFMRFYGEEVPVARNRVWGAKSTPCGAKDVKSIGS